MKPKGIHHAISVYVCTSTLCHKAWARYPTSLLFFYRLWSAHHSEDNSFPVSWFGSFLEN